VRGATKDGSAAVGRCAALRCSSSSQVHAEDKKKGAIRSCSARLHQPLTCRAWDQLTN